MRSHQLRKVQKTLNPPNESYCTVAFSPRVKVAESRRGAEGGGLGSPLAGFLPNTEISFLMISMKLLDICPVSLLIFSPIKTADFRYYSSRQMMAILCCVA